jgi:hypothetical protein
LTEQGPAEDQTVPRHRRSGALDVGERLATAVRSAPRGLVVVGGIFILSLLLVVGYAVANGTDGDRTPSAADPVGNPPAGSASPSPSSSPSRRSDDDRTTGPDEDARATPRPAPRRVGPADLDGFQKLLADFCVARGNRTAVLREGPDNDPAAGTWACVQVVTFVNINLDEACRREFGDAAQARQTKRGDARTWRCFDA